MHKVQRMEQHPTSCLYCGRGNTPDDPDTMDDFWAIDLERDVNWGDSTYLCKYCAQRLSLICGFMNPEQAAELEDTINALRKRLHKVQADLDSRKRRLDKIAAGAQAVRQTRKEAVRAGRPARKRKKKKVSSE